MIPTITPGGVQELSYRDMLDGQTWQRVTERIVREEQISPALAARILNEALGFLKCASEHPDIYFAPSPTVDIGWHTLILYTREYAALCDRLGGFIHHEPDDLPGFAAGSASPRDTMRRMESFGYPVDEMLWAEPVAGCGGGGGCGSVCGIGGGGSGSPPSAG